MKTFWLNPLHEKFHNGMLQENSKLDLLADIALSITDVYRPSLDPMSAGVLLSKRIVCIRITEKRVVKSRTVEFDVVNCRGGTRL